jgi:hypothetical protein
MAPRKKFPTETEMQQLEQEGFSQDQITGLLALRALYTQGVYQQEDDPERNRQEFIRWLYLQGRLQS